ncbi:hypothetical protein Dsin_007297 [Dipteronia sinensis]|uniref:Reverse transcriptase domain-containing protein n=1 Tax=Dipteronia sinensis TaxID=43782 RepID=A0AAE0B0W1_9ROSI|nr:hypothetical protein Dsin_007297 [Dipteronia sinensis]
MHVLTNVSCKKLMRSEMDMLEAEFTTEEVWDVLDKCDGNKAPGPDGLNLNFFKAHWEVIREDFMRFIKEFHKDGTLVKDLNNTFLTLILKTLNPVSMGDFMPISLIGAMYKIFAKVLANLIKKVMHSIIGEFQMAFVKGRQIIDSFVIAEEIINMWKKDQVEGLLVKLDFEKAYDSVDHGLLDYMMECMGFGDRWRGWICNCISTPFLSVLVNGSPTSQFSLERGH